MVLSLFFSHTFTEFQWFLHANEAAREYSVTLNIGISCCSHTSVCLRPPLGLGGGGGAQLRGQHRQPRRTEIAQELSVGTQIVPII